MNETTDLRIVKTKNKLRAAFAKMMRDDSFDRLSINDLCSFAKVRRATFYRHFDDKYDFLSSIVSVILAEVVAKVGSPDDRSDPIDYYCNYIAEVIKYCKANDAMIKNILDSSAFWTVLSAVLKGTLNSFRRDLTANERAGIKLPADVETLAQFLNGGIANVIVMWLTNKSISEEQLIESARSIFKRILG